MVDVAYGPEPGPRRKQGSQEPFGTEAYLAMVRRKRMYGGFLLILFVAMDGWSLLSQGLVRQYLDVPM